MWVHAEHPQHRLAATSGVDEQLLFKNCRANRIQHFRKLLDSEVQDAKENCVWCRLFALSCKCDRDESETLFSTSPAVTASPGAGFIPWHEVTLLVSSSQK